MRVERIHADPRVRSAFGKVALQRGPLVYCLEEVENGPNLGLVRLPQDAALEAVESPDLLGGVVGIRANGVVAARADQGQGGGGDLYTRNGSPNTPSAKQLVFIPYYAWANRAPGEMTVWIRE